ncbi:MAG: rod shape-determining protein MreC [Solirubrobacterales bacterium]
MYRKQIRRRRAVLLGLVALAFILITVTFGGGSGGFGQAVGTVTGPIGNVISDAFKPARDLIGWFDETFAARGENERLRSRLANAEAEVVAGRVAVQENRQFRRLLGLQRSGRIPSGYRPVTARITTRSPTIWITTAGIDRGSSDGIEVDDPVVSDQGLVGKVSSVAPSEAVVTLLPDGSSAVSAKVVPGGSQGVVTAKIGTTGEFVLEFIDETRGLEDGESVVTAGWREDDLASIYPPNLPIGELKAVPIDTREAVKSVDIKPYPDFATLEYLTVLTGGSRG